MNEEQVRLTARVFSVLIQNTVSDDNDMIEIISRNHRETDPKVCHSHDFCDANDVMAQAIWAVTETWFYPGCGLDDLFNGAWDLAKRARFFTGLEPITEEEREAYEDDDTYEVVCEHCGQTMIVYLDSNETCPNCGGLVRVY